MSMLTTYTAARSKFKKLCDEVTSSREPVIIQRRNGNNETFTDWMKKRFDSLNRKYIYSHRIGTVEPVFTNICRNIGLNRFTLRGKLKVDIQWKLFCIVHNIGKIVKYAPRFAI